MNKYLVAIAAPAVVYLGLALGNPEALRSPHLWTLVALTFLASVTQPSYRPIDLEAPKQDRGTATQIVWTVYLTQALGVIEAVYVHYPRSLSWDWISSAALVAGFAGMAFRAWAVHVLGKHFTWHIRSEPGHDLVMTGPYAFVRHPGYTGAVVLYVATLVVLHAWLAAALGLIGMLFAFGRRLNYEEVQLLKLFGPRYETYRGATKMLIPYVW